MLIREGQGCLHNRSAVVIDVQRVDEMGGGMDVGAYSHRLQPGYVGVFNPDLHQVRFAVFDIADQFHFHLAHVGDGVRRCSWAAARNTRPLPG